nr:thiopeptide-type bacteriocin biosynthesis protein [uncultured Rhodococcus sp.]
MTKIAGDSWTALHIHRTGSLDRLLVDVIEPEIKSNRLKGNIDYFFVRYWLGGNHLRVRLRGTMSETATQTLRKSANDWLRRHPSEPHSFENRRDIDRYVALYEREYGTPETGPYFDGSGRPRMEGNDAVVEAQYIPEIDRYGGPLALAACERHFQASSDIVLDLLGSGLVTSRAQRIGRAAQLLILSYIGSYSTVANAADGLESHAAFWARYGGPSDNPPTIEDTAVSELTELASAVSGHSHGLPDWCQATIESHRTVTAKLSRIGVVDMQRTIGSLVHMTNNRLGVDPFAESYAAAHAAAAMRRLAVRRTRIAVK